jgi:hypothetical protein
MFLESLIVKGIIVMAKAIVAKGATAKVGLVLYKSITTYGLTQTLGSVAAVGLVVGGITWTVERVNNLTAGIKALENNDATEAVCQFGRLALSLNVHVQVLPDAVHDYLVQAHVSEEHAKDVANIIRNLEEPIARAMKGGS